MPPWSLILIGFGLSILGVTLPFLMMIQVIPSTYFLNFLSFTSMLVGLILGVAGAAQSRALRYGRPGGLRYFG